ncbi:MAG: hypothetical protein KDK23_08405, partial [Leptospiraceae bacterium]|nr:hypothetical protein [Leptospiraceae bacterium]
MAALAMLLSGCVKGFPNDGALALASLLGSSGPPELGSVRPLYPASGVNWNDYVLADGPNFFSASDTPCVGTEMGGYRRCIHGGEKRYVTVSNRTSCGSVTATDSLNAFVWTCDDSTGTVRMITGGLRDDKHLSDLIDFASTSFRPISVTVTFTDTGLSSSTASSVWWFNPVVADPAPGVLSAAGTVYIFTADPAGIYDLNADRIAFVGQPGVTLQGTGANGEQLLRSLTQSFLWVEGDWDIKGDNGINFNNTYFSVMRNVRITQTGPTALLNAIVLNGNSSNNFLSHIRISGELMLRGLENGAGNRYNTYYHIHITGPNYGFYFGDAAAAQCDNNVLLNYLILGNASVGLISWDSDSNVLLNGGAMWSNGTYAGVVWGFGTPSYMLTSNMYSINHNRSGFGFSTTGGGNSGPSDRNQVADIALLHNQSGLGYGFSNSDPASLNNYVTGLLITGNNGNDCEGVAGNGI